MIDRAKVAREEFKEGNRRCNAPGTNKDAQNCIGFIDSIVNP